MARIVIELTNRCNLRCQHCFSGRHGGKDDLPVATLQRVLSEARDHGFDHLSFTGGDPTTHRRFKEILGLTYEAGYFFSFVTNGWTFSRFYPELLPFRDKLKIVTFSLDGADEETHDRLRGRGSYRRAMQAMSVCVVESIPFSINMVLTAHNRHQLECMAHNATRLGSHGLRFCHLMPAPMTTLQNFDLTPQERKILEAEIWQLRRKYSVPIEMAPGHYSTDLFPCAPLQMQEVNIDCRGNLSKCCHLSGHGDGAGQGDIIGNLLDMSFTDAYEQLRRENEAFHAAKVKHFAENGCEDTDFFPCWYCSLYYKKVSG